MREWSLKPWQKLDINELEKGASDYDKKVNRLPSKVPGIDMLPPYQKLKQTVRGFLESVPLIGKLKNPAIQERHWRKIMEEAGKDLGEINLKTITLAKVFELELQYHQDKVDEIVNEAQQEANNESRLQKIEQVWKVQTF